MYKIVVFIPEAHKEKVKVAMFTAGAGAIGDYDKCCFETLGTGQFRPLADSKPFIGSIQKIETIEEYRVEMICREDKIKDVIKSMKENHPYSEVAYDIVKLHNEEF